MLSQLAKLKKCPVCAATVTTRFARLDYVPVNCSILWNSEKAARDATRGHIELALCGRCGMIFNGSFEPSLLGDDVACGGTLPFSGGFHSYTAAPAARLIAAPHLR